MVWCIINQYRIIYWINKCASTFSISLQFLTCTVKIYIYIAVGQQCSKYSRNYWRFGRSSGMEQTHELCVTGFSQRHSVPGGADLFFLPMWRLKELIWMLHVLFQNSTQSHSFAWSQQLYELDTEKYWQILHLQRNKSVHCRIGSHTSGVLCLPLYHTPLPYPLLSGCYNDIVKLCIPYLWCYHQVASTTYCRLQREGKGSIRFRELNFCERLSISLLRKKHYVFYY